MPRLKKTAAVINVDDEWYVNTDTLRKNIKKDFQYVNLGEGLLFYRKTAEAFDVDFSTFDDIAIIHDMSDADRVLRSNSVLVLIERINNGSVKIDPHDKFIVQTDEGMFYSTDVDFDSILREVGDQIAEKFVSAVEANPNMFDAMYDKYMLSGVDDALEKQ